MERTSLNLAWTRSLRRRINAVVGVCALAGLAFTWWAAWQAEVVYAVVGAIGTVLVLVAGAIWSASTRLAMVLLRNQRRVLRLERRLDSLAAGGRGRAQRHEELMTSVEQTQRRQERISLQVSKEVADAHQMLRSRLEAFQARLETFSRLYDDQVQRLDLRVGTLEASARRVAINPDAATLEEANVGQWSAPDSPPGERTVAAYQHLVAEERAESLAAKEAEEDQPDSIGADVTNDRRRLRSEFAGFIHRADFRAALAKGDEIVNRFPNSTAARDFRRVRPHLVRRIQLSETARQRQAEKRGV